MHERNHKNEARGFSLLELLIAMVITMVVMSLASTLLASALRIRSRENQKSDALADTQRALNTMSREIAGAGFNLNGNGIVDAESSGTSIRMLSNLNKYDFNASLTDRNEIGAGEDITYFVNEADKTNYLVRRDNFGSGNTVLANRLDSFNIHYFDQRVRYSAPANGTDITNPSAAEVTPTAAKYIVIAVSVQLNQVGTPGSPGYQPAYTVLLCSDVTLRNASLWNY
jgi:Tfp pilus assembly protein PilW